MFYNIKLEGEENKMKKFLSDFKAFISRGNILDMAVGVVIGGAFGAIVTALVNILLSVCLWAVPGGLKGLVTVLPAINNVQKGMNESIGLGQKFAAADLHALGVKLAEANYSEQLANNADYLVENPNLIESSKATILGKYTLHGTTYTYNMSAVIDWGAFINAVISFIIIAIVLFIIVKVAMASAKKREELKKKAEEEKYKKWAAAHPEEAAELEAKKAAEAEEAGKPQVDPVVALLEEIRDELKSDKPKEKAAE